MHLVEASWLRPLGSARQTRPGACSTKLPPGRHEVWGLLACGVARTRRILHVDMDAFYASVEVRDDPSLAGKPLLIGGRGRRSVVATASYEARKFGCHSAQPMAVALRRCPHAVVVPPRIDHYAEVSAQLFEIFREFTPVVEGLSLDEAFLDLTGTERLHGLARAAGEAIRARVRERLRLTCSVGVAANKFVAKIASDLDKPDGLTEVPPGTEQAFLAPLAIRKLWGVGPKTRERLAPLGVRTIGDLARIGEAPLVRALGDQGAHLFRLSLGLDARPVERRRGAKSVSCEQTVGEDLVGREALEAALLDQATRLADRLAHQDLEGRCVAIKIRDIAFHTQTRQVTLPVRTRRAREIHKHACALLDAVQVEGRRFRLIGIGVSDFTGERGPEQLDLLAGARAATDQKTDEQKEDALQEVLTSVRDKFGAGGLFIAKAGKGGRGSWDAAPPPKDAPAGEDASSGDEP